MGFEVMDRRSFLSLLAGKMTAVVLVAPGLRRELLKGGSRSELREGPKVCRLLAGGNGIRTLGPPVPVDRLERTQRTEDDRWALFA